MHFSIDRTVHTTAFDKPVVDHWLEQKIAQTAAGSTEKDRSDDRPLQRRARYRLSYVPLWCETNNCRADKGFNIWAIGNGIYINNRCHIFLAAVIFN